MKYLVNFTLNGTPVELLVKPTDTLLDILKEELNTTSPKRGCDQGDCGTCTVLINGASARACLTLALTVMNKEIETVEGLIQNGELHPLQQAFHEKGASQCGFCTPGLIMTAKEILDQDPHPTRERIIEGISGNLCRCGAYLDIVEAIQHVADGRK
jgi:carbon-monoxide dehydrogenase small subunit